MKTNSIQAEVFEMDESALQEEAVTKEMRQSLVESFFREAFAQVNSRSCIIPASYSFNLALGGVRKYLYL